MTVHLKTEVSTASRCYFTIFCTHWRNNVQSVYQESKKLFPNMKQSCHLLQGHIYLHRGKRKTSSIFLFCFGKSFTKIQLWTHE